MQNLLDEIRRELLAQADENIRLGYRRFSKEPLKGYGVKTAAAAAIAKKAWAALKSRTDGKAEVFALSEELWSSG